LQTSYVNILDALNDVIDPKFKKEVCEGVDESFEQCCKLFENCQFRFVKPTVEETETLFLLEDDDEVL